MLERHRKVDAIPGANVSRLHGIIRDGDKLMGILFHWIGEVEHLDEYAIPKSLVQLRRRWAKQLTDAVGKLQEAGIDWGGGMAWHVIIDSDDDAWGCGLVSTFIVDWMDQDKVGTMEDDMLMLARLLDMLQFGEDPGGPKCKI